MLTFNLRRPQEKSEILLTTLIPFLEVMTHKDVLYSMMFEQVVADVYIFLYGIGGRRATTLFGFLAETLQAELNSGPTNVLYSRSLTVLAAFLRVLECNRTASSLEGFRSVVETLQKCFDAQDCSFPDFSQPSRPRRTDPFLPKAKHSLSISLVPHSKVMGNVESSIWSGLGSWLGGIASSIISLIFAPVLRKIPIGLLQHPLQNQADTIVDSISEFQQAAQNSTVELQNELKKTHEVTVRDLQKTLKEGNEASVRDLQKTLQETHEESQKILKGTHETVRDLQKTLQETHEAAVRELQDLGRTFANSLSVLNNTIEDASRNVKGEVELFRQEVKAAREARENDPNEAATT